MVVDNVTKLATGFVKLALNKEVTQVLQYSYSLDKEGFHMGSTPVDLK
jgi:hypothetical protein